MSFFRVFLSAAAVLVLVNCQSTWRQEPNVSKNTRPADLVAQLGEPPVKLTDFWESRFGRVDEYRYYLLDDQGKVHCYQVWFSGDQWRASNALRLPNQAPRKYRLLNPARPHDRERIEQHHELNRWLVTGIYEGVVKL